MVEKLSGVVVAAIAGALYEPFDVVIEGWGGGSYRGLGRR